MTLQMTCGKWTTWSTWYCKIIWDHRFKWSKIGFGSHSSYWLCKALWIPTNWPHGIGQTSWAQGCWWVTAQRRFECSTSRKRIIQGHLNTGIKTQDFPHWHCGKLARNQSGQRAKFPSDRHHPQCPAFQPLKRSRRAWRIPWSGASIARHFYHVPPGFQHACR